MSTQQPKEKKKAKNKNWYFTAETDLSIQQYNESTDPATKNRIFNNDIKPAFYKLTENIIHTFKFYYTDGKTMKDVQHEVVSFLVEKLPKFANSKGKAFSYFSIVAKNYLILNNNKNYKKLIEQSQVDSIDDEDYSDVLVDQQEDDYTPDFIDQMVAYFDVNLESCFPKRNDQLVANAIIELFRRRDNLEIFNKKALYIYIREMTDANTQQITKIVRVLKNLYKKMYSDYDQLGYIQVDKVYTA